MKDPLSNSLKHELASTQAGPHPDADVLTAFAEGTLTARERSSVLSHLALCAECREVAGVAAGAAPERVAVQPQVVFKPVRPPLRSWLPWVATAASVVVVCSAVLLHEFNKEPSYESLPIEQRSAPPEARQDALTPQTPAASGTAAIAEHKELKAQAPVLADKSTPPEPQELKAKKQTEEKAENRAELPKGASPAPTVEVQSLPVQSRAVTNFPPPPAPAPAAQQRLGLGNSVQTNQAYNKELTQRDSTRARQNTNQMNSQAAGAVVSQAAPPTRGEFADKPMETEARSVAAFSPSTPTLSKVARADAATVAAARAHWRIDDSGKLQRSFGTGEWFPVLQKEKKRFRVVAVIGSKVWAGGEDLRLYLSSDNGENWNRIELPKKNGGKDAVTRIHFQTALVGTVESEGGSLWHTDDGGKSWK